MDAGCMMPILDMLTFDNSFGMYLNTIFWWTSVLVNKIKHAPLLQLAMLWKTFDEYSGYDIWF